ncbi:MAG: MarR family transcriptional regulator [Gemmatimonadaceae bacterium]
MPRRTRESPDASVRSRHTTAATPARTGSAPPVAAGADVIRQLRCLERGLRLVSREVEGSTTISAAQLFVLEIVARQPATSLAAVAAETHTDRSSVSVVIERLVARGLVRRRVSAADRRRSEVHITAAGRRVLARAPTPPTVRLLDAVASLSAPSRQRLAEGLAQLNDALGFSTARPGLLFEESPGL